jgi:hypothetical protein
MLPTLLNTLSHPSHLQTYGAFALCFMLITDFGGYKSLWATRAMTREGYDVVFEVLAEITHAGKGLL